MDAPPEAPTMAHRIGGILGTLGCRFDPQPGTGGIKDPALPQRQCRSQLRLASDPWPGNSTCHRTVKEKKEKTIVLMVMEIKESGF